MAEREPFFIGWEAETPKPLAGFLRILTVLVLAVGLTLAGLTAALQRTVGPGTWDFTERKYSGILFAEPVPMLLESSGEGNQWHLLVKRNKFGFTREEVAPFHLQAVAFTASELSAGEDSMLEVVSGMVVTEETEMAEAAPEPVEGEQVWKLRGEIVDSKCWLGAMNPGILKPHRACAIHCLRGGIPVGFLASDEAGNREFFLLTGPQGEVLNDAVLDVVAEPVEVSGMLSHAGTLPVLRIDPAEIIRLSGE